MSFFLFFFFSIKIRYGDEERYIFVNHIDLFSFISFIDYRYEVSLIAIRVSIDCRVIVLQHENETGIAVNIIECADQICHYRPSIRPV